MKLIQICDVDGEPIGLWSTEEEEITSFMLVDWFRSYDNSDMYEEKGVDGFEEFVEQIGYKITREFVETENIY